jgi:hypothetical protein
MRGLLTASNKLGDRLIAAAQVAGVLATGWFVWINAVLPRLGLQSLASIAAEALFYVTARLDLRRCHHILGLFGGLAGGSAACDSFLACAPRRRPCGLRRPSYSCPLPLPRL